MDKSKLRQVKPQNGTPPSTQKPNENQLRKLRKLKPEISAPTKPMDLDPGLVTGARVNHTRFGRGKILNIEGAGNDRKAEIHFDQGGIKKLLLRFAKLEVLDSA